MDDPLQRSNRLRAIHKLCIIDTVSNFDTVTDASGFKADGTFAKCHKIWKGRLFWCKSCNSNSILLCGHCAVVCHQSCDKEEAAFRTILHRILHYIPCSCRSLGYCQLTRPVGIIFYCIYIAFVNLISCLKHRPGYQQLPT